MRRRSLLLLIPFLTMLAGAVPAIGEFERALLDAEAVAEQAAAVGRAAAGMQNALAWNVAGQGVSCADPTVQSLVARSRYLGHAYRDAAQAFRVRAAKVDRLRALGTVAPLLTEELATRAEDVVRRAAEEVERYRTTAAWQAQLLERLVGGCDAPLTVAPGLPLPGDGRPVAVIAIGDGLVCPAGVPARGAVVVLEKPEACFAKERCDCTPEPVGLGAVLGEGP